MSKDRFDRLDDDIFEKAPAPPVQVTGTRFTRADVLERARTQAEILRASGVTTDPEVVARLRAEAERNPGPPRFALECPECGVASSPGDEACAGCGHTFEPPIIIDSLRATQCENCGRVVEGVCNCEFSDPHVVSEPGTEDPELPADPRAWLFHVCTAPLDSALGERPWVVFTPIAYWRTHHAQIDQHIDGEPISEHIPSYLEEVSDSTFVVLSQGPGLGDIRDQLRRAGFQEDPRFSAWVDPEHPDHHQVIMERAAAQRPGAANAAAVRNQAGRLLGFENSPNPFERALAGEPAIETREITLPLLSPEEELAYATAREQEAELRRRQYRELADIRNPHMWCFTVTHALDEDRTPVLILVHRYWWEAYQQVPIEVRVTWFVNDWLPSWVHGEMSERPGCFYIDFEESGMNGVQVIGHFERMGLTLIPLMAASAGFPV